MISSNWIEKEEWLPEFTSNSQGGCSDHPLQNHDQGSSNMLYHQVHQQIVGSSNAVHQINANNALNAQPLISHHHYDNNSVHILATNSNSPADSFDPDLDEVDEKFIDSLLNNTLNTNSASNNHFANTATNYPTQFVDFPDIFPSVTPAPLPPLPAPPPMHNPLSIEECPVKPHLEEDKTPKKTTTHSGTPQFRWRRRKRRSKAQYPEMSRYLLPIDSGDEVQHLGRTLECTLCGLRGKRCHLTLHFKAKHSEVIEFNGGKGNSSGSCNKANTTHGATLDGSGNAAHPEENDGANTWIKNGYKILDLEEALGKAFLFIKDTLSDDHDEVVSTVDNNNDRQNSIESACMKKIINN